MYVYICFTLQSSSTLPYNTSVRINLQPHNEYLLYSHDLCYFHTYEYTQKI